MAEAMIKARFSTAIPKGMVILTFGAFIVHVGWRSMGFPPGKEFETAHFSEQDREEIEAVVNQAMR